MEDSKKQVIYNQLEFLKDLPIKKYENFVEFIEKIKTEQPKSTLAKSAEEIEKAIELCFEINQTEEGGSGQADESIMIIPENMEEIAALNINVDDA